VSRYISFHRAVRDEFLATRIRYYQALPRFPAEVLYRRTRYAGTDFT
jgi:hypothetical protein